MYEKISQLQKCVTVQRESQKYHIDLKKKITSVPILKKFPFNTCIICHDITHILSNNLLRAKTSKSIIIIFFFFCLLYSVFKRIWKKKIEKNKKQNIAEYTQTQTRHFACCVCVKKKIKCFDQCFFYFLWENEIRLMQRLCYANKLKIKRK